VVGRGGDEEALYLRAPGGESKAVAEGVGAVPVCAKDEAVLRAAAGARVSEPRRTGHRTTGGGNCPRRTGMLGWAAGL